MEPSSQTIRVSLRIAALPPSIAPWGPLGSPPSRSTPSHRDSRAAFGGMFSPAPAVLGVRVCSKTSIDVRAPAPRSARAVISPAMPPPAISARIRSLQFLSMVPAGQSRIQQQLAHDCADRAIIDRRRIGASHATRVASCAMTTDTASPEQPQGLRRELKFVEAIALSLAIMAPTAAMALNGTAVAGLIGRAVPLAFVIATVGVMFVSYGFIRLTRYFNSAGSVFALAGATLGPRAGFFAGFALMGTYTLFTVASAAEVGLFGQSFLDGIGVGNVDWLILALIAMVFVAVLAFGDIRVATRSLLGMEGISVMLILVLMVVIFAKVIGGSAPSGQHFTLNVFTPTNGISFSTVAIAAVFGFLSFGGFEGAASLGEETNNPGRNIPRAIFTAVVVAGAFYIVCMVAQSLGFGLSQAGIKRFSESSGPLGDLGKSYIGSGFADVINFGATVSAFAATLGAATAASRILYAISRDAFAANRLGRTSTRSGAPAGALAVILGV